MDDVPQLLPNTSCSYCGSKKGVRCVTNSGSSCRPHLARRQKYCTLLAKLVIKQIRSLRELMRS